MAGPIIVELENLRRFKGRNREAILANIRASDCCNLARIKLTHFVTLSSIFRTLQTSVANPCAIAGVWPFDDECLPR
jgi:hypothetical protein